jgi:glycosyltransferase involved in cell wall biosynthesis
MRIIIGTPVLHVGGTEAHTLNLVRALRAEWPQVEVLCYYDSTSSMVTALEQAGAKVTLLGLRRSDGLLKLFLVLRQAWRRRSPDVVHVQYIAPGLIPILAARAAGVRTVFATVHQPGDRFGAWEKTLLRTAARVCTAFFCVSRAVEASWFGDSAVFDDGAPARDRRHFTIYNGVAIEDNADHSGDPAEEKRRYGLQDRRTIGIVARLRREKGHAVLFKAIPAVAEQVPQATVLVVGDGPEREALAALANRLGIESRIVWMGERGGADVQELYRTMDVVAVPSLFEGFGMSAAEAMAAGRPVVASKVGGLAEVIGEGQTGRLVNVADPQALARALIELLNDSDRASEIGAKGRLHVQQCFSSGRFSRAVLDAYRRFSAVPVAGKG